MDEVLEKLSGTIITQNDAEEDKSNFEGLYKNWGKLGHQEERRREILEVQKSNRNNKLDQFRGILDLINAVEEKEIFYNQQTKAYYRPSIYVAGFNKTALSYSNVLMLSEWMIEKPGDLAENWYLVPCPKGVRMLVVANQGRTKFYSKYGHFKFECRTVLPGGHPNDKNSKNRCCVLDCFYYEKLNTMFVLDLLAWNCQPMTDGETEFRHYWLESQLSELPQLKTINKNNKMIFKVLPKIPCDTDSLNKFMQVYPPFEDHQPPLDGLLFYHKRAHYFAGQTPLVGWLFPYMLPEVIGDEIKINAEYELAKPKDYVSQADFIMKFEEKANKRKSRSRHNSTNSMDTAELKENETIPMEEPIPESAEATSEPQTEPSEMEAEVKDTTVTETEVKKAEVKEAEMKDTEVKDTEAGGDSAEKGPEVVS